MTRICQYALICFALSSFHCQDRIDYIVPADMFMLKQPKDMDCWITVATMMVSWKEKKKYSIEEIAKRLGDPWLSYYEMNTGLPASDQDKFIKTMKLKGEAPASHTINAYLHFLKSYGPIWITTGDGLGAAHARILIGLKGTGDYDSTTFILIDPATGLRVEKEALVFLNEFEEEARAANAQGWESLRIQLYHF